LILPITSQEKFFAARCVMMLPDQTENRAGPHEGEAADDQGGNVAARAPADLRSGEMAGNGRSRLPRGAHQVPPDAVFIRWGRLQAGIVGRPAIFAFAVVAVAFLLVSALRLF